MVEVVVLALALLMGLLVRQISLPPLVGFLMAGFALPALGPWLPELQQINFEPLANLGVTLLLFGIGLKLNLRSLFKPYIWGVATIHMGTSVLLMAALLLALKSAGLAVLQDLHNGQFIVIGFALSFSSTVFAVKVLEERGEMVSLHGRIAIGVLIIQDIIAVLYLSAVGDATPQWYAPVVLLLLPLRPLFLQLLKRCGHGELLVLAGLLFAFGAYALFDGVGLKGDLGALIMGVLLAGHGKSSELSKALMNFKDLLLVGFFLSIGQAGLPSGDGWLLVLIISLGITFKPILYFLLLLVFKLRVRTALFSSLTLNNYSEFGLIVLALSIKEGLLPAEWLVIAAITMSLSFVIGSVLDACGHWFYAHFCRWLTPLERRSRLPEQQPVDIGNGKILIMGMGRVGSGAYHYLRDQYGDVVVGFEEDPGKVAEHSHLGRRVLIGDASDGDLWGRLPAQQVEQVILALSNHAETVRVAKLLRKRGYEKVIAAVAKYPDEVEELKELGVIAFNFYAEAGAGFAEHVHNYLQPKQ